MSWFPVSASGLPWEIMVLVRKKSWKRGIWTRG
jgi:hypothetical protein